MPIAVPKGVDVRIDGTTVTVKGPRGELARDILPEIKIEQADGQLLVTRPTDQPRHRAMHGLTRTLVDNMVRGVTEGFAKTLEMQGVGYRAQMQGKDLQLAIGFSHPVKSYSRRAGRIAHVDHAQRTGRAGGRRRSQDLTAEPGGHLPLVSIPPARRQRQRGTIRP
jgi:ribosomal protein L6P/L9E